MLLQHLNHQLHERAALALQRTRRTAESACAPLQRISHGGQPTRAMLAFCSNDYLGLANHPSLIQALAQGAQLHGAGSGASHLINGHSRAHATLEQDLAQWMQPYIPQAQALYFCTGYMANLALLSALGDRHTTLFADKLNHASLIDGASLSKAALLRYPHGNLQRLETLLTHCTTPVKLIVTDAVFSMDGDLADLPALLALAQRFDAWLIVDDAHGFGVLGAKGRGSLAHYGLCSERLIYMGTLGKAAGVGGAFVAAHPTIIDWLVQTARPYIYTTAAPPAIAHALCESLRLVAGSHGDQLRMQLQQRIAQLRKGLGALVADCPQLGWRLADSTTAIQALIIGDNAKALAIAAALEAQGLWVPAIRPPTVPSATARLRITLSAAHSAGDVQCLLDGLAHVGRTLHGTTA